MNELTHKDMKDKGLISGEKIPAEFSDAFENLGAENGLNRQLSLEMVQTLAIGKIVVEKSDTFYPVDFNADQCEVDFSDKIIDWRN